MLHLKYLKSFRPLARPVSAALGRKIRHRFSKLERFCLFVGYPRSGHTLVGSILDAHPEITISTEADVLGLIDRGWSRDTILAYIVSNSWLVGRVQRNRWSGYSYRVPGGHQGDPKHMRIIGDKKGSKSTRRLRENPELLSELEITMGCPIRIIHVVRNPYDIVSTMYNRNHRGSQFSRSHLGHRIEKFFRNAEQVLRLKEKSEFEILDAHHEDLIENPVDELTRLFEFVGAPASNDYLEACRSILYTTPNRSRFSIEWPPDLREMVAERLGQFPFLARYRFDEPESSRSSETTPQS